MKKHLFKIFFILLMYFSFNIVYAEKTLVLDNPVISFRNIDKYGLQGFTTVDNYLFMILEGYDDTKAIIKVYDLDTFKEVKSYEYGSLGHSNDVTYNRKNNKIYVIASSGSNIVYTFNGDSFLYEDEFDIGLPVRSITYVEDEDIYAVRTVSVGFKYDSKFNLISKVPFVIGLNFSADLGRQGWAYYNNYIYYANWSWIRLGGDGANIIYVYDLNGRRKNTLYTENNIGELEDIAFYNNKMVLGFNGYDKNIKFYMVDIPGTEDLVLEETKNEVSVDKVDSLSYIWIFLLFFSVLSIGFIFIISKRKR